MDQQMIREFVNRLRSLDHDGDFWLKIGGDMGCDGSRGWTVEREWDRPRNQESLLFRLGTDVVLELRETTDRESMRLRYTILRGSLSEPFGGGAHASDQKKACELFTDVVFELWHEIHDNPVVPTVTAE